MASAEERAELLLEDYGQTFAEEIGIALEKNEPAVLFQWLVAAQLFAARISAEQAATAAQAIFEAGLTTPEQMCEAGWEGRVKVLGENGYARFDESTASQLGDSCKLLIDRYGGDLRKLRAEADGDPDRLLELLQEFKGIGPLGAQIFAREVQAVWTELQPFADDNAIELAEEIELGEDADELEELVGQKDLPALLCALVRADIENVLADYE